MDEERWAWCMCVSLLFLSHSFSLCVRARVCGVMGGRGGSAEVGGMARVCACLGAGWGVMRWGETTPNSGEPNLERLRESIAALLLLLLTVACLRANQINFFDQDVTQGRERLSESLNLVR